MSELVNLRKQGTPSRVERWAVEATWRSSLPLRARRWVLSVMGWSVEPVIQIRTRLIEALEQRGRTG